LEPIRLPTRPHPQTKVPTALLVWSPQTDLSLYVLFGGTTPEDDEETAECSSTVAAYDTKAKTWKTLTPNGTNVPPRRGAGVAFYKNSIVAVGGSCGAPLLGPAVFRLDLGTPTWSQDTLNNNSRAGPNVTDAAVFVIDTGLYVIGGSPAGRDTEASAWMYDLENKNWTLLSTPETYLLARAKAGVSTSVNRVFIIGGENDAGDVLPDASQFVLQNKCLGYKTCEDCSTQPSNGGCGWCNGNNEGYRCLAGGINAPYVVSSCNASSTTYVSDIDFCPQAFPSYAIALLVIGGVVVIGVIIFAIMKVRSGEKQQEYEKIS